MSKKLLLNKKTKKLVYRLYGARLEIKKIKTENDKTLTEIVLPYDITPGMYYIVLIDEKKKKQYTDKLIVQ